MRFNCPLADLSNDDEEDDDDPSSSLALSYCVPQPSLASSTSSIKKQRSLTPDKDIDQEGGQSSNNFHLNLKKQRSLTPERRTMSLTPEERRKIITKHTPPATVRQYELAKGSALESQKRLLASSRSSSSSSYSGDETRPRRGHVQSGRPYSNKVSSNNVTSSNNSLNSGDHEHRIRRSR